MKTEIRERFLTLIISIKQCDTQRMKLNFSMINLTRLSIIERNKVEFIELGDTESEVNLKEAKQKQEDNIFVTNINRFPDSSDEVIQLNIFQSLNVPNIGRIK